MRKAFHLFFLYILFSSNYSIAQECGVIPDSTGLKDFLRNESEWKRNQASLRTEDIYEVSKLPVKIHILLREDGTGGILPEEVDEALRRTNQIYFPSKIHFFVCGDINYVKSNYFYDFNKTLEDSLKKVAYVPNVINIYFANSITSGASTICGYAHFPNSKSLYKDAVFLSNNCTRNGSSLAHELGHYFNLYHTHESFLGKELVSGGNCGVSGDLLCDTPADPSLSSNNMTPQGCVYTGFEKDANGQVYLPNTFNLMSYSLKECRTKLTPSQYNRIRFTLDNYRTYLNCNSAVVLNPDFKTIENHTCGNSLDVQFVDVSTGKPNSWTWDFGDNTISSEPNPLHSYRSPGVYSVSLMTRNSNDSKTIIQSGLISVGSVSVPFFESFEKGNQSLGKFKKSDSFKNTISVGLYGAKDGANGLIMEGASKSSNPGFTTPDIATAFAENWNPHFKSKVELCVDARILNTLKLTFNLKQIYFLNNNYTNFRVTVNGVQVGKIFQPSGATSPWNTISVNLSSYVGKVIVIGLESSCKYTRAYADKEVGNANLIDNIQIDGVSIATAVDKKNEPINTVELYPNPFDNFTNLKFEGMNEAEGEVTVFDIAGRVLIKRKIHGGVLTIGENLESGVYYCLCSIGEESKVIKIVKK